MTEKNIIVALDDPLDYQDVLEVLDPKKCIIKVGSVIFNYHGRKILDEVSGHGFEIFFDIKFHDIPNTVSKSIESFKDLWLLYRDLNNNVKEIQIFEDKIIQAIVGSSFKSKLIFLFPSLPTKRI